MKFWKSFPVKVSLTVFGMLSLAVFPVAGKTGAVLKMGTAVDDDRTVDIAAPGATTKTAKKADSAGKAVSGPVDSFFAAPLGNPNDPNKYKYTGPVVGGHDPSKIDWSRYGAQTPEQKRFFMVEYAQGRLKIGPEYGGVDQTTDSPPYQGARNAGTAQKPSQAGKTNPAEAGKGPPTSSENGEEAWINTIQNPTIAPKSSYRNDVMGAIDRVIAAGTGLEGPGSDKITDYDAYHAAVVTELRRQGFRALHDGEELAICRPGDSFNEQFDISTASGLVRRFYAAYIKPAVPGLRGGDSAPAPEPAPGRGGSTPAPAPHPSTGGLEPSPIIPDVPGQKALCNTIKEPNIAPKSQHRGAVNKAIDLVIAAGTGLKGPGSDEIADYDTYHRAVVIELRNMGYCAAHDGEELAIKRPGQDFNEQFDISTASMKVRRFYAAWLQPPSVGE